MSRAIAQTICIDEYVRSYKCTQGMQQCNMIPFFFCHLCVWIRDFKFDSIEHNAINNQLVSLWINICDNLIFVEQKIEENENHKSILLKFFFHFFQFQIIWLCKEVQLAANFSFLLLFLLFGSFDWNIWLLWTQTFELTWYNVSSSFAFSFSFFFSYQTNVKSTNGYLNGSRMDALNRILQRFCHHSKTWSPEIS